MRRLVAGSMAFALLLVVAGWVAPSSAGAVATPWGWGSTTGTGNSTVGGAVVTAYCPDGYRVVTGGVDAGDAFIQSEVFAGGNYSVAVKGTTAAVTLTAWCALSSQVVAHMVDRTLFPPSGSFGLGDFACDGDMTPLSASLTWNSTGGGTIAQSGPEAIGGTNEWFVVARSYSPTPSLHVQLLCVANADLPGANWVTQSQTAGPAGATETVTATCPDLQRLVTGGEHIDSVNGTSRRSYPVGPQAWTAVGEVPAHDTLSVAVLCVPDGDPIATFRSVPRSPTNSTTATFFFDAVDPAGVSRASNWCFLNTIYLGPCGYSYTVTGLTEGQNVFSIEAVTPDGRGGAPTEKDDYFWVDLTPPTVTLKAPPPVFTLGKIVNLQAVGTDSQGIDHYHVMVTARQASGAGAGSANPVFTGYDVTTGLLSVPVKAGTSYRFDVTAIDTAVNVSSIRSVYTSPPLDNFDLTASSQWTLVKGAVYTNTLVSRTKARGATLTHAMYGTTLGVVATTCSTCGQVGVYAGTRLLKTIDLRASSTHYKQVITVPMGSLPVQTQVTLRVLSTNKLVEIDGLGAVVA